MRLIDADALEDKAKRYSLGYYEADEWAVPLEAIDEAPTIEPKHVEWIDNGDRYFKCSICGAKDTDTYPYCHGCGAKMDGERKESE